MTRSKDTAGPDGEVLAFRRPPVRESTVVHSDVGHTFDVFVDSIGQWWPVTPFSAGRDRVRAVTVEHHVGGRVYETWDDGTEVDWGLLQRWDPPAGFTVSWLGTPAPTEVEFTFTTLSPAITKVAVEHRGWEALSAAQLAEDCAMPGGYTGGAYVTGWATILERFGTSLQRRAPSDAEPFSLTLTTRNNGEPA